MTATATAPTKRPTIEEQKARAARIEAAKESYARLVARKAGEKPFGEDEEDELAKAVKTLGLPPGEFAEDVALCRMHLGQSAELDARPPLPSVAERAKAEAAARADVERLEAELHAARARLSDAFAVMTARSSRDELRREADQRIAHLQPHIGKALAAG